MNKLKIFVSSPGDVGQERLLTERVLTRLQGEFAAYFELEPVFWEDKPMEASQHFQEQIADDLYTSDIVLCVLWQRLGTQLPLTFVRADGSPYLSGTEWEFETAIELSREKGRPAVMVYKKTKRPELHLYEGDERRQREEQIGRLEEFWQKWFGDHIVGFKAAYTGFEDAESFEEKLETHLRQFLKKNIPAILADEHDETITTSWFSGSPYRGLEVFNVEHSSVFFGRTKAITEIKDCLIRQEAGGCSFLLVLGRSGCGKSSLVRAGVIPTMTHPGVIENIDLWYYAIYRPGDYGGADLFTGLASAFAHKTAFPTLLEDYGSASKAGEILRQNPKVFIEYLEGKITEKANREKKKLGLLRQPGSRVLLYIDQFEEVFSSERYDEVTRRTFIDLLETLATCGFIWVMASMRSDLYERCSEDPTLIRMKFGAGQYDLLPPTFAEIGSIIQKPTYTAGLRFEKDPASGQTLDEVLHEVAAVNPSSLPLLEFTLAELYKRREGNVLTFAAYNSLGGMEGALAFYAESIFSRLEPDIQQSLPGVLRLLISLEGEEEKMISNRVLLKQLANDPHKMSLIHAFVEARLLVSDNTKDGSPMVGVAHEAVLRCWPRVQQWLSQEQSFLRTRAWLSEEAMTWQREEKREEYLLAEGKPLESGREALKEYHDDLNSLSIEYVMGSDKKSKSRKRRRRIYIGVAIVMFVCTVFTFLRTSWGEKMVELRHDVEMVIEGNLEIAIAEKFDKIDNRVAFLDIDDATFNKWGKPLTTPRDKIAELLEMLDNCGAKIIVFDIFFDEPDYHHPEADERLRQVLRTLSEKKDGPQIVFPTMIYHDGTRGSSVFDELIDDQTKFFRGVPYILVKSDYDHKIRYWSPYGLCNAPEGGKTVLWGTPLLAATLAAGDIKQLRELEGKIAADANQGGNAWQKLLYNVTMRTKGHETNVAFSYEGKNEQQKIRYYMIPKGVVTPEDPGNLFMQSVLVSDAERMVALSKNIFKGKIVIIGNSAPDKGDDKPTPVGTMPGMYVVGNVINNIIK